jgi:hypothetical protein
MGPLRTKAGRVGTLQWDDLATRSGRVRLAYGDATTIVSVAPKPLFNGLPGSG